MTSDLRETYRSAAAAVPPMGDVEQAVRSGRHRRRAATLGAPLAVLALVAGSWLAFAAGGGGPNEPPVAQPDSDAVTAADLAGQVFVTTVGRPGEPRRVTLSFGPTDLTVASAQSSTTYGYTIDGEVLAIEPGWYSCGGVDCDLRVVDLIGSRPTLTLDGGELTLTGTDRDLTFTRDRTPANSTLDGVTWVLESWTVRSESSGSGADIPDGVRSTLRIDDGVLSAEYNGCFSWSAVVEFTDATITVGSVTETDTSCMPSAAASIESAVNRVLFAPTKVAYLIGGETLTVTTGGGQLVYRATP